MFVLLHLRNARFKEKAAHATIGSIERTRFAGIPLAALDAAVARPL